MDDFVHFPIALVPNIGYILVMKATDLKEWMSRNGKVAVDVASILHMNPKTVTRFLAGKSVHRSTELAFERLTKEDPHGSGIPPEPEAA